MIDDQLSRDVPSEEGSEPAIDADGFWTEARWVSALVLLFGFAYVVRIIGVDWGGFNEDEHVGSFVRVLAGELVPTSHIYPPLNNYTSAVGVACMFVASRLLGLLHSAEDFRALYFNNVEPFYLAARAVTAFWVATTAPVAVGIGRRLGFDRTRSLVIGVMIALLPVTVWWAHVAKPDVPMTPGCLLAVLAVLVWLDDPASIRRAAGLGLAAALAVAFRPSGAFFLLPLLVGTILVEARRGAVSRLTFARQIGVGFLVGAVTWCLLNIGIILDFSNFLEYQAVQAQISSRSTGLSALFTRAIPEVASVSEGATYVPFLAFLALPALDRRPKTMLVWGTVVVGMVLVVLYAGHRTPPYLMMPFSTTIAVLGLGAMLTMLDLESPLWPKIGAGGLVVTAAMFLLGSGYVWRESLRPAPAVEVVKFIKANYGPETRVLSAVPELGLPPSLEVEMAQRQRHERLADKYDVELPPMSEERLHQLRQSTSRGYYVFPLPWVLGGLHIYKEEEVKVVKAYAWPRQNDEWTIDHWLKQGFEVVVLSDESHYLGESEANTPEGQLYRQVTERCERKLVGPVGKPIYQLFDLTVYECSDRES